MTESELNHKKELMDFEDQKEDRELSIHERKNKAQKYMGFISLFSMLLFTLCMFFVPESRVSVLSDISNLFYISLSGVVIAYMGATAFSAKVSKNKGL